MSAPPRTVLLLAIALVAGLACDAGDAPPAPEPRVTPGEATRALQRHSAEFERRVVEVTEGVHVAVGFALANSILLEGDDGVVIVDTTESVESARAVKEAFDAITTKPVAALVYTHNHADHVFGARGFLPVEVGEEEGGGRGAGVPVYAHETTNAYIDRVVNVIRPIIAERSARMFGTYLPHGPDGMVNAGIGPHLALGHGRGTPSLVRPDHTFADRLEVTIAGIRMELVHAPGETNDQILVWLPERRVLLPGDNVYKAFPNLYTIRGTLYRDVLQWVESLDRMRALRPEHLVPSHTRPVSGAERIQGILTAYRDAIQYVHDQTVRGMNRGLTPDELVEVVKLPPHLRDHPYLQEHYGTVEWSVRSVFSGYLGWFDGDAATLSPAPPDERAAGLVALAGGPEALAAAVRGALDEERFAWAAELASALVRAAPGDAARRLEARALRALGRRSPSPNGRNYLLTQARELEGTTVLEEREPSPRMLGLVRDIPVRNFMASLPVNLDAERAADVDLVVGFRFTDVGESYTVHVRRGVAELREAEAASPDARLVLPSRVWKDVLTGQRNPALAFASGDVRIEGSRVDALRFLALFGS